VNETAHGVRGNQPQQPQDEHYYSNGIKHDVTFSLYEFRVQLVHDQFSTAVARSARKSFANLDANNSSRLQATDLHHVLAFHCRVIFRPF
jgi:hypothetical protein